jgi:hypothetical protein
MRFGKVEIGARKTKMVVALARKLLIGLWRMVTTGEIPQGVVQYLVIKGTASEPSSRAPSASSARGAKSE